jgi:hypothetical protein
MAPTTIELAFLPVKSDELSDTFSKTYAIFEQALEAVAYQPGFSAHYFGFQVKNPDVLQLVTGEVSFSHALYHFHQSRDIVVGRYG